MEKTKSFIAEIEQSIIQNWDQKALTDFKGLTLQYKDVAREIAKCHIAFQQCGINKGDKVAICGRNSAHWCVAFLAVVTYGAIAVPILHEFKADNIHNIVNHSDARILFVGDLVWENLNEEAMPRLESIILLNDFSGIVLRRKEIADCLDHLNELFGKVYPRNFRPKNVCYQHEDPETVALINYTSGTTGYSKGVMLPYRSLWSNILYCRKMMPLKPSETMVAMLPMGHVFGMTFDFLHAFSSGAHLYFLTRIPSPKIISQSFPLIKPRIICSVPLIVEKIIKKDILPKLDSKMGKLLLHIPVVNDKLKTRARQAAMDAFGGNFDEIIIGGAPFNPEVEAFLKMIDFPYTVGYGMTETGPIITSERWDKLKLKSCGKAATNMEVKIDSQDPENIPGEIICRGMNVMLGYYKNQEATNQVIDVNGWMHTGDMGIMDTEGNITIKGRSKNMLLTASGQNVYPEEIEARLNNMSYVSESLIVMQKSKLIAFIYPDFEDAFAHGLTNDDIRDVLEKNRTIMNKDLPTFSQIAKVKIFPEEFEKTGKKSIKRFLYQEAKG